MESLYKLPASALDPKSDELDSVLQRLITAAELARSNQEPRWTCLKDMYMQEAGKGIGRSPFNGWDARPTSLVSSRVDRLAEAVFTGLTKSEPYCQASPLDGGQQQADDLETGIQAVVQRSGFDQAFRIALRSAALYSPGILWVRVTDQGVKTETVSPDRFVALPAYERNVCRGHLYGHRVDMTLWEAEEMREKGGWRKEIEFAAFTQSGALSSKDGASEGQIASENDWQTVAIYHLLVKLQIGKRAGWWSIIYHRDQNKWLKVEEYALDRPWYVPVRLHFEPNLFWPETSPANRLQGMMHDHTTMQAIIVGGAMFKSVGVLVGGPSLKDGFQTFQPGQLLPNPGGTPVSAVFPPISIEEALAAKGAIEQDADAALGLSKLGTAQELDNATATETSILKGSQDMTLDAYAQHAAEALEEVFALVQHICTVHASAVQEHAKWLGVEFYNNLTQIVEWKASGRAADNAPSVVNQKLAALVQMSQNPNSILDPQKVEEAAIRGLQIPVSDIEDLKKENQDAVGQAPGMVEFGDGQALQGLPEDQTQAYS